MLFFSVFTTENTVFKSKWQIVNLCSSKTTSPKTFKFSVNIGNNWPFCYAKTQILILNSLGVIEALKSYQFHGKNQFLPATLARIFFFIDFFLVKQAWTLVETEQVRSGIQSNSDLPFVLKSTTSKKRGVSPLYTTDWRQTYIFGKQTSPASWPYQKLLWKTFSFLRVRRFYQI